MDERIRTRQDLVVIKEDEDDVKDEIAADKLLNEGEREQNTSCVAPQPQD